MTNYIKYEVKVYASGATYWFLNNQRHREEGPAIVYSNGDKEYYLKDQLLTDEEFNERMTPTVEMTMAQINEALGKKVKVVD